MNAVTLLATVPAILAMVNFAKKLHLKSDYALILAVVLGVALNVADYLFAGSGLYAAIAGGLILGLSAAGLYDVSKASAKPVQRVSTNVTLNPQQTKQIIYKALAQVVRGDDIKPGETD